MPSRSATTYLRVTVETSQIEWRAAVVVGTGLARDGGSFGHAALGCAGALVENAARLRCFEPIGAYLWSYQLLA